MPALYIFLPVECAHMVPDDNIGHYMIFMFAWCFQIFPTVPDDYDRPMIKFDLETTSYNHGLTAIYAPPTVRPPNVCIKHTSAAHVIVCMCILRLCV